MCVCVLSHKPILFDAFSHFTAQLYNLQQHISSLHCHEKPHSCTHQGCTATFSTKVSSLTTNLSPLVFIIDSLLFSVAMYCDIVGPAYCMFVCIFACTMSCICPGYRYKCPCDWLVNTKYACTCTCRYVVYVD